MISDPEGLADLIAKLTPLSRIALDTEADSLHSYFEKLCLIQISTQHENLLVDPLAGFSLQPLYEVLARKRLVLHGADYDLRMLHRAGQFAPMDIFDTMIAARLCGYQELGLAALVARHFGVKLSKASQKANWALRPLSSQMIEYAVNDTKYLLPLAEILEAELLRLNRWEWFSESCDRMIASAGEPRGRDEGKAWRIPGTAALSPRAQSVLRVLWHWRDVEARSWDRPPFHVMSNDDIVRIAEKAVDGKAFSTPRMSSRRRKSFEIGPPYSRRRVAGSLEIDATAAQSRANRAIRTLEDCQRQDRSGLGSRFLDCRSSRRARSRFTGCRYSSSYALAKEAS